MGVDMYRVQISGQGEVQHKENVNDGLKLQF